ncbi:hypothetical protein VQL36_17355 [Chengkuizengella sp. SCS-71B]|uniref:hypothetical protein n=1 Tax=Chengkuizengella sp. SCS-71B TaxID=3115290 RepID=UPI0032C24A71
MLTLKSWFEFQMWENSGNNWSYILFFKPSEQNSGNQWSYLMDIYQINAKYCVK